MRLKDKVAVVTGGASGIGLATVHTFVREGASVALWDVSDKGGAVAKQLSEAGHKVVFTKVQVTDKDQVLKATEVAMKQFGRIDILINNAGITKDRTLLKMSIEEWNDVIAVNLTGVFNCTQAVAPAMISQRGGRIVNVAQVPRLSPGKADRCGSGIRTCRYQCRPIPGFGRLNSSSPPGVHR